MFIAVDGIDGAGKTTLARRLVTMFAELSPLLTKEPTGTSRWGKALRNSAIHGRMSRDREIEFFHKDRVYHLENEIGPALERGRLVICDRYVDSMLAFQARSPEEADLLYAKYVDDIVVPDVTLILDCEVDIGISRIKKARSRLSAFEDIPTLERARNIYRTRRGRNYAIIDASGPIDSTTRQACSELGVRFPELRPYLTACDHDDDAEDDLRAATA